MLRQSMMPAQQLDGVEVPRVAPERTHIYHLYTIKHRRRDALAAYLSETMCRLQSTIRQPCRAPRLFASWAQARRLPRAFDDQNKILSLPMFAEITREQQDEVIRLIKNF